MTTPAPDLLSTFVHLRADGSATSVPWTPDIWRTLVLAADDLVVGARRGEMPTDFHPDMWEMHPHRELLYLLSDLRRAERRARDESPRRPDVHRAARRLASAPPPRAE